MSRVLLTIALCLLMACAMDSNIASISISPNALTLETGQKKSLSALVKNASGDDLSMAVTWVSSDADTVNVSSSGELTGVTAGTATVTAAAQNFSASVSVTVTTNAARVAALEISPTAPTLNAGSTQQFSATATNALGTTTTPTPAFTWTVTEPSKASITGSGLLTALAEGNVTVTLSAAGKTTTSSVTISAGATQTLSASAKNAVGRTLVATFAWVSSDPAIATVSNAGVVTTKTAGSVVVTATTGGKSARSSITVSPANNASARQTQQSLISNGIRVRFWQYLPADYATSATNNPLLIFLHGAGETSRDDALGADATEYPRVLVNGPPKLIKNNNELCFIVSGTRSCFIVLSPQAPKADGWWNVDRIRAVVDYAKTNLRVDTKRMYVTGLSMGGGGTWSFARSQSYNPTRYFAAELAAIVPIAGAAGVSTQACNMANQGLPMWAFHGSADTTVLPERSREFVNALNGISAAGVQCTPNPVKSLLTEYPGVGHDSWSRTYDPANRFNVTTAQPDPAGVNIYEWLLSQSR